MIEQATIDALKTQTIAEQHLFIDGKWQEASDRGRDEIYSPIDGALLTTAASATAADVDAAVAAARRSFESGVWSRSEPALRKRILHKIGDLIAERMDHMAVLGVRDNGTEMQMAYGAEPGSCAQTFHHSAECVDKIYGEIAPTSDKILGLVHRNPVGVVGVIIPWNTPLMITAWKVSAALAVGNSVVLKPSEDACLNVLELTRICQEAGLPDGVLNVVTGSGAVVGDALARHMDVDVLAFTGSGRVGRLLLEASAQSNMKRVYLELGGKSPNIVFADAPDLDMAAAVSAKGFFKNAGQVCVAPSRLLVEESKLMRSRDQVPWETRFYQLQQFNKCQVCEFGYGVNETGNCKLCHNDCASCKDNNCLSCFNNILPIEFSCLNSKQHCDDFNCDICGYNCFFLL